MSKSNKIDVELMKILLRRGYSSEEATAIIKEIMIVSTTFDQRE